jgi:hypothetical protein
MRREQQFGMAIVWKTHVKQSMSSSDSGFSLAGVDSSEATVSDFTLSRVESDQDDIFAQHPPTGQCENVSETQPASHPPPSPPPARPSRERKKKNPPNPDELKISTGVVKAFGLELSVTDQVDKKDAVLLNKVFHKSWEEPKEQMEQVEYVSKSRSQTMHPAVYVATVRRKKKPAGWIAILAVLPTLTLKNVNLGLVQKKRGAKCSAETWQKIRAKLPAHLQHMASSFSQKKVAPRSHL